MPLILYYFSSSFHHILFSLLNQGICIPHNLYDIGHRWSIVDFIDIATSEWRVGDLKIEEATIAITREAWFTSAKQRLLPQKQLLNCPFSDEITIFAVVYQTTYMEQFCYHRRD